MAFWVQSKVKMINNYLKHLDDTIRKLSNYDSESFKYPLREDIQLILDDLFNIAFTITTVFSYEDLRDNLSPRHANIIKQLNTLQEETMIGKKVTLRADMANCEYLKQLNLLNVYKEEE